MPKTTAWADLEIIWHKWSLGDRLPSCSNSFDPMKNTAALGLGTGGRGNSQIFLLNRLCPSIYCLIPPPPPKKKNIYIRIPAKILDVFAYPTKIEWPSLEARSRRDWSSLILLHKIHCGDMSIYRKRQVPGPCSQFENYQIITQCQIV